MRRSPGAVGDRSRFASLEMMGSAVFSTSLSAPSPCLSTIHRLLAFTCPVSFASYICTGAEIEAIRTALPLRFRLQDGACVGQHVDWWSDAARSSRAIPRWRVRAGYAGDRRGFRQRQRAGPRPISSGHAGDPVLGPAIVLSARQGDNLAANSRRTWHPDLFRRIDSGKARAECTIRRREGTVESLVCPTVRDRAPAEQRLLLEVRRLNGRPPWGLPTPVSIQTVR